MWGTSESEALSNCRAYFLKSIQGADLTCDTSKSAAWAIHSGRPYGILDVSVGKRCNGEQTTGKSQCKPLRFNRVMLSTAGITHFWKNSS